MKNLSKLALLLFVTTTLGCSPKPSLVGTWNGVIRDANAEYETTMIFKADGTLRWEHPMPPNVWVVNCTYKLEGETLVINGVSNQFEGDLTEAKKATMQPIMDEAAEALKKSMTPKVSFQGNDNLTLTDPDGLVHTLVRRK